MTKTRPKSKVGVSARTRFRVKFWGVRARLSVGFVVHVHIRDWVRAVSGTRLGLALGYD